MDNRKLYVGNLPWAVNNQSLFDMFAPYGAIIEAIVITDRATGRSKGFGFVTFEQDTDAERAIAEMHDKDVNGRKLVVNVARPRESQ